MLTKNNNGMKNGLKIIALAIAVMFFSVNVQAQKKNIVELAVETESLSTLVTAVKAAGLVETLTGEGPLTVFAPTNAAFEALPEGVLEMLLEPENKDKLAAVLTYHVVAGEVYSKNLKEGQKPTTVQGEKVNISLKGGATVNGAKVAKADIKASNGVVHVIDQVILPPSMSK